MRVHHATSLILIQHYCYCALWNENEINTQIIANGLLLSLRLHLASLNQFLLQQLLSFIAGNSDKEIQQIWRSLENLKSNCDLLLHAACSSLHRQETRNVPFHPADAVCYLSHFSHQPPSLRFSWKTTTTDLFSFVSTGAAVVLPYCMFSFSFLFSLSLNAKHKAVENKLFIKKTFSPWLFLCYTFLSMCLPDNMCIWGKGGLLNT